jgi:hypothetical protein
MWLKKVLVARRIAQRGLRDRIRREHGLARVFNGHTDEDKAVA